MLIFKKSKYLLFIFVNFSIYIFIIYKVLFLFNIFCLFFNYFYKIYYKIYNSFLYMLIFL